MFECAFIYVAPGLDPEKQRTSIPSSDINMNVVGCANYAQAEEVAKEMVAKGCSAVELCAGFGAETTCFQNRTEQYSSTLREIIQQHSHRVLFLSAPNICYNYFTSHNGGDHDRNTRKTPGLF